MRSKFVSLAQCANAEATAYCDAAFSGTGSLRGFSRVASMLGNSRNVFRNAENSAAAPAPLRRQRVHARWIDRGSRPEYERQIPMTAVTETHSRRDQMRLAALGGTGGTQ